MVGCRGLLWMRLKSGTGALWAGARSLGLRITMGGVVWRRNANMWIATWLVTSRVFPLRRGSVSIGCWSAGGVASS